MPVKILFGGVEDGVGCVEGDLSGEAGELPPDSEELAPPEDSCTGGTTLSWVRFRRISPEGVLTTRLSATRAQEEHIYPALHLASCLTQ